MDQRFELAQIGPSHRSSIDWTKRCLTHTIDYGQVHAEVERVAGEREYRLVEALAEQIAAMLLKSCPIESCTVTVRKRSPVAGDLRHAGVRITRSLS